jgi:hypothetical protein
MKAKSFYFIILQQIFETNWLLFLLIKFETKLKRIICLSKGWKFLKRTRFYYCLYKTFHFDIETKPHSEYQCVRIREILARIRILGSATKNKDPAPVHCRVPVLYFLTVFKKPNPGFCLDQCPEIWDWILRQDPEPETYCLKSWTRNRIKAVSRWFWSGILHWSKNLNTKSVHLVKN